MKRTNKLIFLFLSSCVFCSLVIFVGCPTTSSSSGGGENYGTANEALERFQGLWLEDERDEGGYLNGDDERLLFSFDDSTFISYLTDPSDINTVLETGESLTITTVSDYGEDCDCWLINYTTGTGSSAALAFAFLSDDQIYYLGENFPDSTFTQYEGTFSP